MMKYAGFYPEPTGMGGFFMRIRRIFFCLFLYAVSPQSRAQAAPPALDAYSLGVSLFHSQNYAAALPLFQQAVQANPADAMAHYYLGSCQETAGDLRGEVLNYCISDKLSSDPGLRAYADKAMDKLSLEDQDWVEQRLAAFSQPPASMPLSLATPAPAATGRFGVRLSTEMSFFNLSDFQADLDTVNSAVQGYKAANPSYNYNLQTAIPFLQAGLEVNPYFTDGQDTEWGAALAFWPATSVTYAITDIHPQYFVRSKWDLSSFELLLKGRFYFPKTAPKGVRFYLEPAAGIQPIALHWTDDYQHTAATPSSNQEGWDAGSTALGAGLLLGTVVNLGKDALFSFSAGYQLSSASDFQGTWNDAGVPSRNGAQGSLKMFKDPSTGHRSIIFIPNNPDLLAAFNENQATLNDCGPFTVDLSGFRFKMDISYTF